VTRRDRFQTLASKICELVVGECAGEMGRRWVCRLSARPKRKLILNANCFLLAAAADDCQINFAFLQHPKKSPAAIHAIQLCLLQTSKIDVTLRRLIYSSCGGSETEIETDLSLSRSHCSLARSSRTIIRPAFDERQLRPPSSPFCIFAIIISSQANLRNCFSAVQTF
jgi:hypothetical protein